MRTARKFRRVPIFLQVVSVALVGNALWLYHTLRDHDRVCFEVVMDRAMGDAFTGSGRDLHSLQPLDVATMLVRKDSGARRD